MTSNGRVLRRLLSTVLFVFALLGLLAGPVSAHADVIGSEPADGSTLESRPYPLRLDFNEEIDVSLTTIEIAQIPSGVKYDGAAIDAAKSSGKTAYGTIPALPAGDYVLTWKSSGEDGHLTSGQMLYSVSGASGSGVSATPSQSEGEPPTELALSSEAAPDAAASDATASGATVPEQGTTQSLTPAKPTAPLASSVAGLAQPIVTAEPEVVVPSLLRDTLRILGRTAWYVSASLIAGTLLALIWLSRRAVLDLGSEERVLGFLRQTLTAGWIALFVSALLRILIAIPVVPGKNQLAAAGTAAGRSAWAILTLTLVFAAVPLRRVLFEHDYSTEVLSIMAGLVVTIAVVDLGGWGHAKALGALWIAIMTIHLAFVAAWVGIVSLLAIWMLAARREESFGMTIAQQALRSFGDVANSVVAAVVITGAASAWQISGRSTQILFGSEFGRYLILKLALLVALVAPAALYNRKSSVRDGSIGRRAQVLKTLPLEAAGMLAVLVVAAVLVGTSPTATKQTPRQPVAAAGADGSAAGAAA